MLSAIWVILNSTFLQVIKAMKKLLLIFLMCGIIPLKVFCQKYSLRICIQDCQVYDKTIFSANNDTVLVSKKKNKLFWMK